MVQNNPESPNVAAEAALRWLGKLMLIVMLASHAATVTAGVRPAARELPTLAPILERILPAMVSIAVRGRTPVQENPLLSDPSFKRFFGLPEQDQQNMFQLAGSGVVIDAARGHVLTSNHLIENADDILVKLSDGRLLAAKKVGADPPTDIALLQIPANSLTGLKLGDSDKLRVGDYVLAIGNPFGLEHTASSGIVSALGRTGLGLEGYESFIQTDAPVNPGGSGGALVNLRGELIGINTAIMGPSGTSVGIGFAIPINMARTIFKQLVKHGRFDRGEIGVTTQDLMADTCKALGIGMFDGAIIVRITPKSPAEEFGLEPGDVITAINGENVRSSAQVRNKLGLLTIGSQVRLDILRQGARRHVSLPITAAIIEKIDVPPEAPALTGVTLRPIVQESPLYGRVYGAIVVDVIPESRAAEAGLRAGDAIVGIDQAAVGSPADIIKSANGIDGELMVQIMRDSAILSVTIAGVKDGT